jgi:hypothetical protein
MVVVVVVVEVVGERQLRVVGNTESHDTSNTLATQVLFKMTITQYAYTLQVYFGQISATCLRWRNKARWVY